MRQADQLIFRIEVESIDSVPDIECPYASLGDYWNRASRHRLDHAQPELSIGAVVPIQRGAFEDRIALVARNIHMKVNRQSLGHSLAFKKIVTMPGLRQQRPDKMQFRLMTRRYQAAESPDH